MTSKLFKALVVREESGNVFTRRIEEKSLSDLPDYDVLIAVHYSSLNYKDALSSTGNKAVTRLYPHTPGVDAAGVVVESKSSDFKSGDEVIVTSYNLGTKISGGFGQFIRVPANWIVRLPYGMTLYDSMIYGTAGFTAAQSVLKLVEHGVKPQDGKILVTGATGGVGSVSVAILAKLDYNVTAVTGKADEHDLLRELGATAILSREKSVDTTGRLLLKEKWAGVVDTVGGEMLATAIKSSIYNGVITCCGNVASHDLPMSVYPFILRGVTLCGIDSATCSHVVRQRVWTKLASDWKLDNLHKLVKKINLEELSKEIDTIMKGQTKGRVVVDLRQDL